MNWMRTWVVACAAFVAGPSAAQQAPVVSGFDGARWIWSPGHVGWTLASLPAGVAYFRGAWTLPAGRTMAAAEVVITADNLFALYVNGHAVGESATDNSAWQHPRRFRIDALLVPGRNVLAVEAVNTLPGPAGLLVKAVVRFEDGSQAAFTSGDGWKCSQQERLHWEQADFDDAHWEPVAAVGRFGARPWGKVAVAGAVTAAGTVGEVHRFGKDVLGRVARSGQRQVVVRAAAPADFEWPAAIAFVGDDCSLYRPPGPTDSARDSLTVTVFNPRNSRAYPEHDLPAPMKVGRKLCLLQPARPGVAPRVLLDAGGGAVGSPSVAFDGRSLLVSRVEAGAAFFHIWRVPVDGGPAQQLTRGPFHDIDPAELPDGRIVFTSTRIGTFEEYHSPPSRALFTMQADGSGIRPLTHTMIFDDEPEVLDDGRIVFIRSDNFFDRGKVETRLHAIHPDGTQGITVFGLTQAPEYGNRLRAYLCGSPAPLPGNRLAFVSGPGITVGSPGAADAMLRHYKMPAGDVAGLPDGRLLCTLASTEPVRLPGRKGRKPRTVQEITYRKIGVLDPEAEPPAFLPLYESDTTALHSPVYVGPRRRPPVLPDTVGDAAADRDATGFLFCRDARFTRNTTAGWSHVRAIRVLAGTGLTTRSSHSYIVHAGNETVELGTVPLAPDGSFFIEVPANRPLALQAVDAEGRAELNEMSWIYVRPGERKSCVGCHQTPQVAPVPAASAALALRAAPLALLGRGRPHRFRGNNAAVTGLMELQFDRFREIAGIDRQVDDLARLLAELRGPDVERRITAAQRLAIGRDRRAAAALAGNLTHDRRELRVAAALALATCGDRTSLRPLLAAIRDPDPLVAQAVGIAIENLTGIAVALDAFAEPRARERQAQRVDRYFEGLTWRQIEDELIDRLRSPDRDLVRRAAVALGHVGSDRAWAALRGYLRREREHNPYPAWRADGRNRGDGARFNALSDLNPRTLQAVTRSLGALRDGAAVDLLADTLRRFADPKTGNLFLAEAAAEALGGIGSPAAEAALIEAFPGLGEYPRHTYWYGDHEALMACHAAPVHALALAALDRLESKRGREILSAVIRSLPIDPDRALLLGNDDYEELVGRVIRRSGAAPAVVETCLAVLGDTGARRDPAIAEALARIHRCWGGAPDASHRAAQVLSLVCRDRGFEPRIRAAFERFRNRATAIPRVFGTGIPVVLELPARHWVCFYLARTLGNLAAPGSLAALIAVLEQTPAEAAGGRPDPLGPGVLFLHDDLTPCWRAAVAWALGRIGDPKAVPVLLRIVGDLDNATDTRHAAAVALRRIAAPASLEPLRRLAADYPEVSTRNELQQAVAALAGQ